jgi:hypothetical protein
MNNLLLQHGGYDDDDDDDDDDGDDIDLKQLVVSDSDESFFVVMSIAAFLGQPENTVRYPDDRRNGIWEEHVAKCRHKGTFVRKYHMTEESFNKLVPDLEKPMMVELFFDVMH